MGEGDTTLPRMGPTAVKLFLPTEMPSARAAVADLPYQKPTAIFLRLLYWVTGVPQLLAVQKRLPQFRRHDHEIFTLTRGNKT